MTHQMRFYNDQLLLEPTAIEKKKKGKREEENKCFNQKCQHWILETVYTFILLVKSIYYINRKLFKKKFWLTFANSRQSFIVSNSLQRERVYMYIHIYKM